MTVILLVPAPSSTLTSDSLGPFSLATRCSGKLVTVSGLSFLVFFFFSLQWLFKLYALPVADVVSLLYQPLIHHLIYYASHSI